jgi:colanic acid biosynthesis glycosyl transferase WcaI
MSVAILVSHEPVKVLVLTNYFPPELGAASQLYSELAESLASEGHEVTVATGFPRYRMHTERQRGLFRRESLGAVKIVRVASSPFDRGGPLWRGLDHLYLGASLFVGGLLAGRHDVVLAYSPPLTAGFAARAIGRLWGRPSVVNVQDLFPQYAIDAGLMTYPAIIRSFRTLERFIYRNATALVVHSEGNRAHVVAHGAPPNRVRVIPNWADTTYIRPLPRHDVLSAEWDLDHKFVVEYAGTMGYQQDLETVLDAAALLRDHSDIAFLLIGDGVARVRLEESARTRGLKNVRFLPTQSREHYPLALAVADVGVVTLRKTIRTPGVPSKLFSIMASGRPALVSVSRDSDAPGIVEDAGAGIWVPPGRPDCFVAAVLTLRADPTRAARMGENARRAVEVRYSRDFATSKFENLFRELAL